MKAVGNLNTILNNQKVKRKGESPKEKAKLINGENGARKSIVKEDDVIKSV